MLINYNSAVCMLPAFSQVCPPGGECPHESLYTISTEISCRFAIKAIMFMILVEYLLTAISCLSLKWIVCNDLIREACGPLIPMQILLNNQLSYIEDTWFSMNSIFILFVDYCESKWV